MGGEPSISPSEHLSGKYILIGAQRLLAYHKSKKECITVSQLGQSIASLYNIRSVVICLLAFVTFLRFDELANLIRSDVKIESDMLKLSD